MSVAEVKETKINLKAWIDQLSDANMLSMLEGVRVLNARKSSWDDLSEYQKENINAGLDDIKHGRVMSSDEFWDQLKNG
jgi:predicted transcriptional regulator